MIYLFILDLIELRIFVIVDVDVIDGFWWLCFWRLCLIFIVCKLWGIVVFCFNYCIIRYVFDIVWIYLFVVFLEGFLVFIMENLFWFLDFNFVFFFLVWIVYSFFNLCILEFGFKVFLLDWCELFLFIGLGIFLVNFLVFI